MRVLSRNSTIEGDKAAVDALIGSGEQEHLQVLGSIVRAYCNSSFYLL